MLKTTLGTMLESHGGQLYTDNITRAEFILLNGQYCVACIRLFCIGPCQVQQRRRSRAQTQHEGGSRDLYPDHEEGAWARGTL